MQKKISLTIIALVIGAFSLSCVTPFYGTARIEKGWHMDAGIAATTFICNENVDQCPGGRTDLEIRFGFNKYFQAGGRIGLGAGYIPPSPEDEAVPPRKGGVYPLLDGGLGLQTAYPMEYITPALRLELGQELSLVSIIGIGKREWLTIGVEGTYFLFGPEGSRLEGGLINLFVTIHPFSRWSVFLGCTIPTHRTGFILEIPLVTIGIGYRIGAKQ